MLSLNWIDYLILLIFVSYGYTGYSSGFVNSSLDLAKFFISFTFGLKFYGPLAGFMMQKFSLSQGKAFAFAFLLIAIIVQILLGVIKKITFKFFQRQDGATEKTLGVLNKILGIFPSICSGIILVSFLLILFVTLPTANLVKDAISSSQIGSFLLKKSQTIERQLKNVFGEGINETINFLTIEPKDNKIVWLNYKAKNVVIDFNGEQEMFKMVNKERASRGLNEFIFDNQLKNVGRKHCKDMFLRGYFSHYTPEGSSPFNRLDETGIIYQFAGENLALSFDIGLAMQGLMNSPGHKANILSKEFSRIGIGIINGGIYGKMYCQEFTD